MRGLLQPGFHSGTVPALFDRLRRAERRAGQENWRALRGYRQSLEEVKTSLQKFVTREMISLLDQSSAWEGQRLRVGEVRLATNRIDVELNHEGLSGNALWLRFECRSGWLTACVLAPGWLRDLPDEQFSVFLAGLTYLYQVAGIDLVHEQIRRALPEGVRSYEITSAGLVAWLDDGHQQCVCYNFRHVNGMLLPRRPANGGTNLEWPLLEPRRLVFARNRISWQQLVSAWQENGKGHSSHQLATAGLSLVGNIQRNGKS
jgi:hypothetical protein